MKRSAGAVLPVLLLVLSSRAGFAQQNQAASFSTSRAHTAPATVSLEQEPQEESEKDVMSKSGMFLGIVGMLAGATIGSGVSQMYCDDSEEGCTGRYGFTGALIAGSALVPLGVHIANKDPQSLVKSLAVSALTGTALYFGTRAIPGAPIQIAPFLAAPVQMVTSIKIETKK